MDQHEARTSGVRTGPPTSTLYGPVHRLTERRRRRPTCLDRLHRRPQVLTTPERSSTPAIPHRSASRVPGRPKLVGYRRSPILVPARPKTLVGLVTGKGVRPTSTESRSLIVRNGQPATTVGQHLARPWASPPRPLPASSPVLPLHECEALLSQRALFAHLPRVRGKAPPRVGVPRRP